MLRYFRVYDPYRLISLFILLTLSSVPMLIDLPGMTLQELKDIVLGEEVGSKLLYVELVDRTAPLMAMADGVLNFIFGRSLLGRHILALALIFFQAAYFGVLLVNNKAYNESNFVPSLIFGFLCFFSFDLLALSPELLASILLLMALNNLFKEIEFRVDRDSIVLNLGVYLGVASLFVFSYSIFLLGTVFILIVFARATFRKILLLIFGYGLVHGILFTLYYCYEQTSNLWTHFYLANFSRMGVSLMGMNAMLVLGAIPMIYFVFSLFMLTREARFTKYQSQLFQVIFLWLAIAILQVWITNEQTPHSYLTFIPPAAYFISHYLLLIRRKWIAEMMLWIFILGLISINHLSRYHMLKRVDYTSLFPKPSFYSGIIENRKIMILGDDISLFQKNRMAGYFLDWDLSRKYFEQPDYYENIILINQSISDDPPEVIIDPGQRMGPIVERIPAFNNLYRKERDIYWKR